MPNLQGVGLVGWWNEAQILEWRITERAVLTVLARVDHFAAGTHQKEVKVVGGVAPRVSPAQLECELETGVALNGVALVGAVELKHAIAVGVRVVSRPRAFAL